MRTVQEENECFGDEKHGASNMMYLIKNILPDELFGDISQGHSGKTSYVRFSHDLAGFARNSRPNVTPFLFKIKLPIACVST